MSLSETPCRCSCSMSSPTARASSDESQPEVTATRAAHLRRVGEERLPEPALVVRDQARGSGEDVAGRAVVAFEPDHDSAGEIALEAQDVVHLRAAPAVDRLVVVADAAEVRLRIALRQEPQPQILRDVGVLVFVDQHVAETLLEIGEHVDVLLEEAKAFEQQVAEVGGVQGLQPLLILGIELAALAVRVGIGFAVRDLVRRQPAVLPAVDRRGELACRPALLVNVVGGDDLLQEADLIVGVEDREVGAQPHHLRMAAQNLHADRMKRAEPRHPFGALFADQLADAQLHLARRLVGEGHGEDLRGPGAAGREDMRDAGRQNARLAGAGPRQDKKRPLGVLDRLALLRIEILEPGRVVARSPRARAPRSRRARGGTGSVVAAGDFGHSSLGSGKAVDFELCP